MVMLSMVRSIWPPIIAVISSLEARNGMCVMLMPAARMNMTAQRWEEVPLPEDP